MAYLRLLKFDERVDLTSRHSILSLRREIGLPGLPGCSRGNIKGSEPINIRKSDTRTCRGRPQQQQTVSRFLWKRSSLNGRPRFVSSKYASGMPPCPSFCIKGHLKYDTDDWTQRLGHQKALSISFVQDLQKVPGRSRNKCLVTGQSSQRKHTNRTPFTVCRRSG